MADDKPAAPSDPARPPVEIQYFEAGCKFFTENRDLLGLHVIEIGNDLGEVSPKVRKAVDDLAVATAERMADIMRMGPKFFARES